jgi:hypothetical protein
MSIDVRVPQRDHSRLTIFDYLAALSEGDVLRIERDKQKTVGDQQRDQGTLTIFDYLAGPSERQPEEDANVKRDHA